MKKILRIAKLFSIACCGLAATAAFGQVTQTWTGGVGGVTNNGTDIGYSNNWGGVLPSTANSDTGAWSNIVSGNLSLVYDTITMASGFGQSGVNFYMAAAQTGNVTIGTDLTTQPTIAIQNVTIDAGAGAFTFGGQDSSHVINWVGRPTGAIHTMINNSTHTATLTPWIRYTAGGGATWELDFSGTGNWEVDSYIVDDNGPTKSLQVDGPGTVFWNPVGFLGANGLNSPITINAGTLVLEGSHPRLNSQAIALNGTFIFAPTNPATAQTISGVISGSGTNIVSSGTLTLSSGLSSYSGDTIISGGELIVNAAETPGSTGPLGIGTIQLTGGTLGFSVNNVFDYSGRFSTANGQAYNIDTAGQVVTFTNLVGLGGTGSTLTKLGAGTLTLAGPSTYTGLTTVSAGKLVFQGTKTGTVGGITVQDGASLGATTGAQLTPAILTLGSGVALEFNNVSSTTTPMIAAGTISAAATVTININSGPLAPGQSYPLISWTSGSAPGVSLGVLNGFIGNLTTNSSPNEIVLNVTATAYKWTGNNNGNWDTTTANNWVQNGGPVTFANGGPALFDDTATLTNVTVNGPVSPTSVTINNNTVAYTIASSGANNIGGSASLIKSGNSTLSLSGGANTYTGSTTISGGMLSVSNLANGGVTSDIGAAANSAANLVINGGTLQYTGPNASSDRSFSVGLSGAIIDGSGFDVNLAVPTALNLTAAALGYSGNGSRTLSLTGTGVSNVLAAAIANNGGATALLKNGPGSWVLTGNSTYTGLTTINNGVLQIGAGGATGALGTGNVVNNLGLDFNRTGSLTVSGAISGTGAVTNDGPGTLILTGNNSYTGGTAINAGTVQVGNGGASGNLDNASGITNNGLLIFNSTSPITLRGFAAIISGPGNVRITGPGLVMLVGQNTYTGWTTIDSGATLQPTIGNEGQNVSSVITNNGTLLFTRQDNLVAGYTNAIVGSGKVVKDNNNQNVGDVSLVGTNTYTGGTWIRGGGLIFGDGVTTNGGSFIGGILFTNTTGSFLNHRFVAFRRPDDFTFSNSIISLVTDGSAAGDQGEVVQLGPNTLTLTGSNSYPGNTTVGGGTLMVGNGGTTGNIGGGNITLTNGGTIAFNHSDTVTITRAVLDGSTGGTGTGQFVQMGSGTTILTGTNTSLGSTTVSNGTLALVQAGGDMNVAGGTLAAGGLGAVGNLQVNGNLNLTNGFTQVTLNTSLSPSNSTVSVSGSINYIGGSLKVVNIGPTLVVGQQFFIFNQSVPGAAAMPIVASGYTFANNLAVDGSITVTAVVPVSHPPKFNQVSLSGTNIVISATNNAGTGGGTWTLRSTNNLAAPLATWPIVGTGSFDSTGNISITNGVKAGQQFFIMSAP